VRRRYERLLVPWGKDTPDARGFWRYAKEHYRRAWKLAEEIAAGPEIPGAMFEMVARVVFDKLASPLVYLYEAWTVLPGSEKARYDAELARIHAESERMAEEAFKDV